MYEGPWSHADRQPTESGQGADTQRIQGLAGNQDPEQETGGPLRLAQQYRCGDSGTAGVHGLYGEKLSLNFQDIDVRSVLQLIADFTDLNLVASDTVQGNITLRLQNVPWDQALDLVLKTKGLDKRKIGNVLLVAPADEIAARERQEMEAQKQIAELAPLRRELIQVNYAKASQIATLFQSVTSGNSDVRGSVTVDDRTNSIIAYQTQEQLDELRRVVTQLDIPVRLCDES